MSGSAVRRRTVWAAAVLLALPAIVRAEPPEVEHQPIPCTVPDQAISVCARVTDDGTVAKSRVYFRAAGDKFYSFVDMTFGGINYCATLPGPRAGKMQVLEYYVQGIDDQYESARTSTFNMNVDGTCEFPPVEKDAQKAGAITVYATNKKQGKKLGDEFAQTGVTFVAAPEK